MRINLAVLILLVSGWATATEQMHSDALLGCWELFPAPLSYRQICFGEKGELVGRWQDAADRFDPRIVLRTYAVADNVVTLGWPSADDPSRCRFEVTARGTLLLSECPISGQWAKSEP